MRTIHDKGVLTEPISEVIFVQIEFNMEQTEWTKRTFEIGSKYKPAQQAHLAGF